MDEEQFSLMAAEAIPLISNANKLDRLANEIARNSFIAGCKAITILLEHNKQIAILEEKKVLLTQLKSDIDRVLNSEQDIENFATIIYLKLDETEKKYNELLKSKSYESNNKQHD